MANDPRDDRTVGLLKAQAEKRGAYDWTYQDVHPVVAKLLAECDALREKLEAAEAERDRMRRMWHYQQEACMGVEAALTEARAVQAAGYTSMQAEALSIARKAWEEADRSARPGLMFVREAIADLTPPADLSAALQRVRDEAWNEAIDAAGNLESIHGYSNAVPRHRIRALRRAPTEGR